MGRKSFKSRSGLRLLAGDQRVPDREEWLVVVVDRLLAERRDLVRVPVALEIVVALPHRGLAEVERILLVAGQRPALGAEGHRPGRAPLPDLVPALRPKGVDVPVDVDDLKLAVRGAVSHQAPSICGRRSRTHLGADRAGALLGLALLLAGRADEDRDFAQVPVLVEELV